MEKQTLTVLLGDLEQELLRLGYPQDQWISTAGSIQMLRRSITQNNRLGSWTSLWHEALNPSNHSAWR